NTKLNGQPTWVATGLSKTCKLNLSCPARLLPKGMPRQVRPRCNRAEHLAHNFNCQGMNGMGDKITSQLEDFTVTSNRIFTFKLWRAYAQAKMTGTILGPFVANMKMGFINHLERRTVQRGQTLFKFLNSCFSGVCHCYP